MPSKKELQEQLSKLEKKIWHLIRLAFDLIGIEYNKHTEGFKKK